MSVSVCQVPLCVCVSILCARYASTTYLCSPPLIWPSGLGAGVLPEQYINIESHLPRGKQVVGCGAAGGGTILVCDKGGRQLYEEGTCVAPALHDMAREQTPVS